MATLALSLAGQFVGGAVAGPIGATIGRALGALAGSAIDNALFGGTSTPRAGSDIRLQGSSEGGAIPRLYGWSRLSGNIIWATELEELTAEGGGAKGTGGNEDSVIAANFAVAFCEGEVQRLGRIWADGQVLDTDGVTLRFYRGTETQGADSLIEAKQENAPAYRGLCYIVFERLDLTPFGNRIPNISVELCRVVGELEPAILAITVIPGATEFGYDPHPRVRLLGRGRTANENTHLSPRVSDWTLSIDELLALCPNLEHVSLVVAWFGDDLRAAQCSVRPKVEAASRNIQGTNWEVAGLSRNEAEIVSTHEDGPAFGGTPSDAAVRAAIADLRARGLSVTLYPILLMDIPAGNAMGQPAYPWRGRIAGEDETDVAAFVGDGSGWDYRRFILHYAALADDEGAEALIIGSELRALTATRDAADGFPFVDALVDLAADIATAHPDLKLTYAADWSEYSGVQPGGGEKLFHLDPLWASPDIDAVGIDNYMPMADWRDGEDHADAALGGPSETGYLDANIEGGEGFDWYYASAADRLAGLRTPITDGAYGEPWVWRFKDMASWWNNAHHNRPGGVRDAAPTDWAPASKPIWFTELGCGAVDKGANEPNVFFDPKSTESARPHFSNGAPDPLAQRQVLRTALDHWAERPMVERTYLWTWDARPWPAFPADTRSWSDGPYHRTGHWLTGRLGGIASDELARAVAADYGVELGEVAALPPLVSGYVISAAGSARDALAPLLAASGLSVADDPDGLSLTRTDGRAPVEIAETVAADGPQTARRRPDPSETVGRIALSFVDRERDYLRGAVTALRDAEAPIAGEATELVLDRLGARIAAERMLLAAGTEREILELTLPPSLAALEVGDAIAVAGQGDGPFEITEIRDGLARRVSARAIPPVLSAAITSDFAEPGDPVWAVAADPVIAIAHLPPAPETPTQSRLIVAASAQPWPGQVPIKDETTGASVARLDRPAALGRTHRTIGRG
ncbi:MAG: glycoside hydrolase/phage tail family protein [Devosia sp.]